jgi:hypothetical protein
VVEALGYKLEGCRLEIRGGELIFAIYLILSATLRNEYQKQKNNVSGE